MAKTLEETSKNCLKCGEKFFNKGGQFKRKKYCSERCRGSESFKNYILRIEKEAYEKGKAAGMVLKLSKSEHKLLGDSLENNIIEIRRQAQLKLLEKIDHAIFYAELDEKTVDKRILMNHLIRLKAEVENEEKS